MSAAASNPSAVRTQLGVLEAGSTWLGGESRPGILAVGEVEDMQNATLMHVPNFIYSFVVFHSFISSGAAKKCGTTFASVFVASPKVQDSQS
jgi:hypothetical protein